MRSGLAPHKTWVRKIPWKRAWQPTPVFLPGTSHGQRSLAGYSPWGCKRAGHDLATKHNISVKAKKKIKKEGQMFKQLGGIFSGTMRGGYEHKTNVNEIML